RYLNEKGEKCKIKAEALLARALQHEIDHLNGKLFINN
ncbi:MAG: peptide deformylase, partial [Candidatus Moranbacteria bacterium]|nr:peptide deformylase [Candidatus Moranbacteria bacterium]